ncbi:ATP-binding protein [Chitinasiproducens palmae]|uniref:histidine kinase n=1 Tax=Chitinasiproducens palmae TaxID=1770053 RepID=A0A1H2PIM8_9BURK|nr:ATP-binding protein [Chitinasiproducens palmae]SDV46150.1 PAS domain S-box-containing protein [Chitinasiproducens palmae]
MHSLLDRESILLRQRAILAEFGEYALRADRLDTILHRACELALDGIRADFAKVLELQPDGVTMLVRAGVNLPAEMAGNSLLRAEASTAEGQAIRTGKPVSSPDIARSDERFAHAELLHATNVRALVSVIIIGPTGSPPYGLLEVDSRVPRNFSDDDVQFLRSYANLLAAAVNRLRSLDEMRAKEAVLREREDHYRASTEHNPQIPWTADPGGAVDSVDARWVVMTGVDEAATLGDGWQNVAHPEDRHAMAHAWRDAVARGEAYDVTVRLRQADGGYRWARVQAYPRRDDAGRVVRWYGTVEDTQQQHELQEALRQAASELEARVQERTRALELEQRERQAAEERLRQSQKMEAVGQLTGGIAHDFNNLLAGITGSLEVVQARLKQGRINDLDRFATAALTSAHRAAALTHRLLAFSRRQTLAPKAINANELIAGMEDLIRRTVGPSISVSTVLAAGPELILCDPNQLENALLNLAINARDAMPGGGKLTIESSNVVVNEVLAREQEVAPGEYVRLAVTDNGTGMPPDVAKRAFDPFFTTKPLGQGTGLGLSMIYGFAKQSGGQVRIHSTVDVGTTVSIHLPCMSEAPQTDEDDMPEPVAPEVQPGEAIMVVDDEAVIRMVASEVLAGFGYHVLEAEDGATALRRIEQLERLDALVTDVGLPGGMNGRQLADAARRLHPRLKVLFITGFADAAVIGNGSLAPGMSILTKPFAMDALAVRVRELLTD